MAEKPRDHENQEIPRPSQAEGDRETIEAETGDMNNAGQTQHAQGQQRGTKSGVIPRPSQAEGDRDSGTSAS
jgi:hypothetical protein